jgi:hypothetical protein
MHDSGKLDEHDALLAEHLHIFPAVNLYLVIRAYHEVQALPQWCLVLRNNKNGMQT